MSLLEVFLASKRCLSFGQDFVTLSLATTGRSNDHETMSYDSGIIELEDFLNKHWNGLNMILFANLIDSSEQKSSVNYWLLGCWEQINDDILE